MATRKKRARPGEGVPDDVKKSEGEKLHRLWKRRAKRSQAAFAADCGFTQGYLPQFFSGLRPITAELAAQFAEELEILVSDFSPRLAEEIDAGKKHSEWPFLTISRERYLRLSDGERIVLEADLRRRVEDIEKANYLVARPEGKDAESGRAELQPSRSPRPTRG